MSDKLQDYYQSFLKQVIKSQEHLNSFMNQADIRKKFTSNEINKLKSLWNNTSIEPIVVEEEEKVELVIEEMIQEDLAAMNKDELDEYSINTYGIDLDKRFSKKKMIKELNEELNKQK